MRQVVAVPQPGFCSQFLLSFRLFLLVAVVIIPKGTILGMVAGPPTSFVQDISIKAAEILMQDRTDDLHFSRLYYIRLFLSYFDYFSDSSLIVCCQYRLVFCIVLLFVSSCFVVVLKTSHFVLHLFLQKEEGLYFSLFYRGSYLKKSKNFKSQDKLHHCSLLLC